MDKLRFIKMNDFIWVAEVNIECEQRFYHVINHGFNTGLKIFGADPKNEIMYNSVKTAMSVAVREHARWLNKLKKER